MSDDPISSAMTDEPQTKAMQPTEADAVTDPAMVPFDDDAGGRTADKGDATAREEQERMSAEKAAAKLGDFA